MGETIVALFENTVCRDKPESPRQSASVGAGACGQICRRTWTIAERVGNAYLGKHVQTPRHGVTA